MVRGDLLRHARLEQNLSMRDVLARGGPSLGLQSAVERGLKAKLRQDLLTRWVAALQVTLPYALGHLPSLREGKGPVGLAPEVGLIARKMPGLESRSAQERAQRVLILLTKTRYFSEVVLAYVLDLPVGALREMLHGKREIPASLLPHLAAIVGLEDLFAPSKPDQSNTNVMEKVVKTAVSPRSGQSSHKRPLLGGEWKNIML